MKKYFSSVLAAAISALLLTPASAEHEWSVNGSVIENDLWSLNNGWSSGTLTLSSATPKVDGLTTLDVSEMKLNNTQLKSINCWGSAKITTVKKLVIPDTMTNMTIENGGMPTLEELCTADGGHELSINTWGKGIATKTAITGEYVIKDVSNMSAQKNGAFALCPNITGVEFIGTFSSIGEQLVFGSTGLKSLALTTTSKITATPPNMCGYYGDQTGDSKTYELASVTMNGAPLFRNGDLTTIGSATLAHCEKFTDVIDLPNCGTVGDYAFRHTGVPFANLMSATSIGAGIFAQCASLERVVFGSEAQPTLTYNQKGGLFQSAFGSATAPVVIWNAKTAPASLPQNGFWASSDYKFTNYIRKEATGWASLISGVKQNFVSMDTVFKVNIRLDNNVVMTTLMPGVSGQNSVWTIPASWFLEAGKTFGEGAVKDAGGTVIDGASATPDGTGLNLTITLPASRVESVDGTTYDDEIFVDMVAQESRDPQITVSIVDEAGNEIIADSFEATVGTSVTRDYGADVFGNNEYYFNSVLSLAVDPVDAAVATFGLDAKLTLENVAKDAEITVKIDRAARPIRLAYWNVDVGNYTMSDGVWTFRCDFTGDKAVIADAIAYNGADYDVAEVDFTKPIGTDGSSDYQVTTLDWGATIDGSAVQITDKNSCGKNVVINGGAGTAATLVGALKIPATVESIAGWGYCANLVMDTSALVHIRNFGKYALARTLVSGALTLSDEFPMNIGDYAFEKCSLLTSLKVPALGSIIGECAFYYCTGMKTVELEGVTSIKWAAFARENSGTVWMEKVVLSPALTNIAANAFYKNTKKNCVFDVALPKDMPGVKSGDGAIAGNAFADLDAGAIIIPFKGTCTIGAGAFHYSSTTNYIFWGKAPTAWIGNSTAVFNALKDLNGNVKTDRMFTVSLVMDQEGWEGVATMLKKSCDAGEWATLNPPEKAFGYVTANTTRIWLCEGKSPWEPKPGLLIYVR